MFATIRQGLANARRILAAAGAALGILGASAAVAGQAVVLRTDVSSGPTITLGDLFDAAGPAAPVMVGTGAPAGLTAVLDAGAVQRIAHINGLDWDNPNGVRRILVRSLGGHAAPAAEATDGRMIDALTYARNIAAGEIVQPTDLVYGKVAAFAAPQDMPSDAETIIGKMAKRPLRAGSAAAAHDVSAAQVIRRDDMVQVTYHDEGIDLTLDGKAMAAAAVGEPVSVLNPSSKKIIQAIAIGPDQAVVGPDAEEIRQQTSLIPTQLAALH